jgi:1-acyl-sn-glycerol-3-phosphate acyltransferase
MIRFLLVLVFLIVFFVFSLIALLIEQLVGRFSQQAKDISSLKIVQGALRIVLFLSGVKTTVIGLENVPKDEPVLFVGNHRGFYDIIVSYVLMKRPTGFIAKKEINRVPIIRLWMRSLYCLFLDRDNMKEGLKTILKGADYIKEGKSMVIFPEGTRNTGEGISTFHTGSFKIAEKAGCKIVPMVQNHTDEVFEKHIPWIRRTHTIIEFGKPVDIASLSKEERKLVAAKTYDTMVEIYEKNQKLV